MRNARLVYGTTQITILALIVSARLRAAKIAQSQGRASAPNAKRTTSRLVTRHALSARQMDVMTAPMTQLPANSAKMGEPSRTESAKAVARIFA